MNTVITLPDGKRIIITPQANPRIVKMVNNVLHKMNDRDGKVVAAIKEGKKRVKNIT